jgi:hypothetical protein
VRYVNGQYARVDHAPRTRRWQSEWIHKEHMPTGRLALRCYSPYSGTSWHKTWKEKTPGDLVDWQTNIVRALEAAAPAIAVEVAELRRRAEEEHQRWLVQHEERLREDRARKEKEAREELERRRVAAGKTSRENLLASIEHWAWTRRVEEFFADVDQRIDREAPEVRLALEERVALARALVGQTDALQRIRAWKTPAELLQPIDDRT